MHCDLRTAVVTASPDGIPRITSRDVIRSSLCANQPVQTGHDGLFSASRQQAERRRLRNEIPCRRATSETWHPLTPRFRPVMPPSRQASTAGVARSALRSHRPRRGLLLYLQKVPSFHQPRPLATTIRPVHTGRLASIHKLRGRTGAGRFKKSISRPHCVAALKAERFAKYPCLPGTSDAPKRLSLAGAPAALDSARGRGRRCRPRVAPS
jgi:hypothetical protein